VIRTQPHHGTAPLEALSSAGVVAVVTWGLPTFVDFVPETDVVWFVIDVLAAGCEAGCVFVTVVVVVAGGAASEPLLVEPAFFDSVLVT
jgi:hypothetical protein